jgi:N-acetylglucosamine kinase-like BadF-type ATPase
MEQMNVMMQKLSHPMRHLTVTDHAKMQDMGKIIHQMAAQMDEATVNLIQERMKTLSQSLEALQKQGK